MALPHLNWVFFANFTHQYENLLITYSNCTFSTLNGMLLQ